jgi:GAF domain-containing protein
VTSRIPPVLGDHLHMPGDWWTAGGDERRRIAAGIVAQLSSRLETAPADARAWSDALLEAAAAFGFIGAAVWFPGSDGRLRCKAFASSVPMELFAEETRKLKAAPGECLPGRAWLQRQPAWVPNVIRDDNFPRLRGAIRDLIRAGVAFPIVVDSEPVGIIEFYSREELEQDELTTAALASLGTTLGGFHHALLRLASE